MDLQDTKEQVLKIRKAGIIFRIDCLPCFHCTSEQSLRQNKPYLHIRIIWTAAPFRGNPSNILAWIFDITCFAMNTILRINL